MSGELHDTVQELLAQSLVAWGLVGSVRNEGGPLIIVSCNGAEIRVEPAPPSELPFRWTVTIGGRRRGAISLIAVLRLLRGALDPAYAMNRVSIGTLLQVAQ